MKLKRFITYVLSGVALASAAVYFSPHLDKPSQLDKALKQDSTVVMVFAHPDDEMTHSALIKRIVDIGISSTLIVLTDGRANPHTISSACPEADIFECRKRELASSATLLGIKRIETPAFPDSKLGDVIDSASEYVAKRLQEVRPSLIVTMEPSGLNYHADHVAAHKVTMEAIRRAGLSNVTVMLTALPIPFRWLFKSAMPDEFEDLLSHIEITNDEVELKSRIAEAHASQKKTIDALSAGMGPQALFTWVNRESFYLLDGKALESFLK